MRGVDLSYKTICSREILMGTKWHGSGQENLMPLIKFITMILVPENYIVNVENPLWRHTCATGSIQFDRTLYDL